ncbi:MAG TPA: serine/threonine-protein kinase [Polyangiaceae bacterium]
MTQPPRAVPERLGPYEVGAKIGGGGMAAIYVGRRVLGSPDGEIVAMKLIRDDLAHEPHYVDMFLDEARILSRLSHPNIIVTRDFGVEEDTRFIAMELLLGRSLMDVYDRARENESRMPLDLAAWVAKLVAEALAYAHDLKSETDAPLHVVHRDVNPTNIFVTYDGDVKLIDFGLAKSSSRLAKSGEGIVKGKVPYLSPEQIEEKPFDGRADVYALGASLWEMTTGRRLFKRDTDVQTIRAIRAHEVPDPRTFVEGLYPEALWKIIARSLEPDPEKRFANAAAMAAALGEFLQKHGRKADMRAALVAWIEELFPGEREKQEAWLAEVSAMAAPAPPKTMAPPAPLAGAPAQDSEPDAPKSEAPASEPEKTPGPPAPLEKHPVLALVAAVGTLGFFVILALVFRRC